MIPGRPGYLRTALSDDFWFRGTAESQQYFNEAILRAVENRIPVIRCANMGVSGIVDAYGRVIDSSQGERPTSVVGAIRLRTEVSVYGRIGDVLAQGCLIVTWLILSLCVCGASEC